VASLEERAYVSDYLSDIQRVGEHEAYKELKEQAKQLTREQHRLFSRGGKASDGANDKKSDVPFVPGERDARAAAICSKLLAQDAAADPVVTAFRERCFGSSRGILTHEAALAYLWDDYRRTLLTEMPMEQAARNLEHRRAQLNEMKALILVDDLPRRVPHPFLLDHPDREATLGDVTDYLHWRFPWFKEDAAWFVLAGDTPAVRPVTLTVEADLTFIIRVHPWTSRESVNAAYDAISTPWIGKVYPPTDEALGLLEFVIEYTGEDGNHPTWEALREQWNAQFPTKQFATYSGMRRAYIRARKKLAPRRL
jgi:hypothetical protein